MYKDEGIRQNPILSSYVFSFGFTKYLTIELHNNVGNYRGISIRMSGDRLNLQLIFCFLSSIHSIILSGNSTTFYPHVLRKPKREGIDHERTIVQLYTNIFSGIKATVNIAVAGSKMKKYKLLSLEY